MSSSVPPWDPKAVPDITEDTLVSFVTHCQQSLRLRHDTIKLYLSGIRFHYIKSKNQDIFSSNLQLPYIMRAIKKTQDNISVPARLPITFSILSDVHNALKRGLVSPFTDLMYSAIFTMAFYGFLRCGEFTIKSVADTYVQLQDINIMPDHSKYTLLLRSSKTDPFGKGVSVHIFQTQPLCPVSIMANYLSTRIASGARPHSPLFLDSEMSSTPLARATFITVLREALARAGYNDSHFSGHSFRIGACTSAAAAGVEDHLLQVLGRWKSGCYTRYIHTPLASISAAQCKMNAGQSSLV